MNGFIMHYIYFYCSQQTTLRIMLQVRVKQEVTVLMYAATAGGITETGNWSTIMHKHADQVLTTK